MWEPNFKIFLSSQVTTCFSFSKIYKLNFYAKYVLSYSYSKEGSFFLGHPVYLFITHEWPTIVSLFLSKHKKEKYFSESSSDLNNWPQLNL